jgi:hypothetical protein
MLISNVLAYHSHRMETGEGSSGSPLGGHDTEWVIVAV